MQNALLANLSSANKEGHAPAAHPVPSDADLVNLACSRLNSLEDDMDAIGDFCNVIIVGLALEVQRDQPALGAAIHRIAREIEARYEAIGEVHSELFHALRRVPAGAINTVLKGVEVEEAAGEA